MGHRRVSLRAIGDLEVISDTTFSFDEIERYSDKERENAPPVDAPGVDRVRGRMLTY